MLNSVDVSINLIFAQVQLCKYNDRNCLFACYIRVYS
ncbi:hypothetical protein BJY26_001408 [Spelaeicoccus albus]|uniref:Uncharacterized protein n=1 Tax=Spelaeicoccus albus TaxID=1280376 RepID=A0A7Z0A9W2_9MICO|nr:hypothetical protein [Spelaeicoccus albus]